MLAILGVGLIIIGFAQGVFNDIVDYFVPLWISIPLSMEIQMDEESNSVFNILLILQRNFLILAYFVFAYFVIVKSQKPVQPY